VEITVPYNNRQCILISRYVFFFNKTELSECTGYENSYFGRDAIFIAVVKFGATVRQFKPLMLLNNNKRPRV